MRRVLGSPVLLVLVLAPVLGEGLSGSTPLLDLLLPWNLAFMAALYGCGALLCREVAHRLDLGFGGLLLLAAGYGIYEEALVDRYWFLPSFWDDAGVGRYSVVWHTNVLLAVHLTLFHTAVSICSTVLVVEWVRPTWRRRSWVRRRGLVLASLALLSTPILYGELDQRPPTPVLVAAVALLLAVLALAVVVGGRPRAPRPRPRPRPRRRGLGWIAFGAILLHWVLTYSVASTGLPWPVGVVLAVGPVAAAALLLRRWAATDAWGADGMRVVVGLLWFFVPLDAFVGLLGRYDVTMGAGLLAWALVRLGRSTREPAPPEPAPS